MPTQNQNHEFFDHNSDEFHQSILDGISEDDDYRHRLDSAKRVLARGGVGLQDVVVAYQVKSEDVMKP